MTERVEARKCLADEPLPDCQVSQMRLNPANVSWLTADVRLGSHMSPAGVVFGTIINHDIQMGNRLRGKLSQNVSTASHGARVPGRIWA